MKETDFQDYLNLRSCNMEDLLMARTFSIVGGMLVISSIGARLNKAYETFWPGPLTLIFEKWFCVY